jgi:dissimilatory sulfite reductase (desulfoviridin) alpha/beta subunit
VKEYISPHCRIQGCAGSERCRNAVIENDPILEKISLEAKKIEASSNHSNVSESKILSHRLFSASASFCPNACSRPQITDFGIIAASIVNITDAGCTGCNACIESCREDAIRFKTPVNPEIIREKCLHCGSCSTACPTGTISSSKTGYRIFIGGMMGRHPMLAAELPDIYDRDSVIELFKICFGIYNDHFYSGLRFRNMILRYPEKLPLSLREIFLTALNGEFHIKSDTAEQQRSVTPSEGNYR